MALLHRATVTETWPRSLSGYRASQARSETVGSVSRGRRGPMAWSTSPVVSAASEPWRVHASRSISSTDGPSIDPLRLL